MKHHPVVMLIALTSLLENKCQQKLLGKKSNQSLSNRGQVLLEVTGCMTQASKDPLTENRALADVLFSED